MLPLTTPLEVSAGCKPTTGSTHQHPVELLFKIKITRVANFSKTSFSRKLAPTQHMYYTINGSDTRLLKFQTTDTTKNIRFLELLGLRLFWGGTGGGDLIGEKGRSH